MDKGKQFPLFPKLPGGGLRPPKERPLFFYSLMFFAKNRGRLIN
jgi:hypothetical protein